VTQHASLTRERWARFTLDQQVLMVANEVNRASSLLGDADLASLRRTYERVHIAPHADASSHTEAFRCLLRFTPAASKQIAHLMP
jgi:hypothetical protein